MNGEQYVNAVVKKVKCGGSRKKEIKKQLSADIEMRISQGEKLEEVISELGTIGEMAEGFNETIPEKERKQYARNKVLKIVFSVVALLILLAAAAYWLLPKSAEIENSDYFDKDQVETAMKETVELFDTGDSASLLENAILEMEPYLTPEAIAEIKKQISEDWGERQQFGTVYMSEVEQKNTHFAVGEIMVTYENVSVVYRLTYDEEMRLAGLYIR